MMSKFNGQWNDWDEKMVIMNCRIDHLKMKESKYNLQNNSTNSIMNLKQNQAKFITDPSKS